MKDPNKNDPSLIVNDDLTIFNNQVRYFKNVIPQADGIFDRLEKEVVWSKKQWNNKFLPRLCCHSVQQYNIGNEVANWTKNFCQQALGVKIEISDIFGNFYRDGKDYLPDHSDQYGDSWVISLSFAPKRLFRFRNCKSKKIEMPKFYLESGDMVLFSPKMNITHKHGIPKQTQVKEGRINLTIFAKCPEKITTNYFDKFKIPQLSFATQKTQTIENDEVFDIMLEQFRNMGMSDGDITTQLYYYSL